MMLLLLCDNIHRRNMRVNVKATFDYDIIKRSHMRNVTFVGSNVQEKFQMNLPHEFSFFF